MGVRRSLRRGAPAPRPAEAQRRSVHAQRYARLEHYPPPVAARDLVGEDPCGRYAGVEDPGKLHAGQLGLRAEFVAAVAGIGEKVADLAIPMRPAVLEHCRCTSADLSPV